MNNDIRTWDERFWEPDEILWNTLFKHRGHKVEIGVYGNWNDPANISLECLDCNEVIADAGIYTLCGREDV